MHDAVVFNIRGPSWRLCEHHGLEIAAADPHQTIRREPHPTAGGPGHSPRIPIIADRHIR
jgi:hypothetical protein